MLPIVKKVKNIGNSGHMPKYDSQKVPLPPSTLFIWPHRVQPKRHIDGFNCFDTLTLVVNRHGDRQRKERRRKRRKESRRERVNAKGLNIR